MKFVNVKLENDQFIAATGHDFHVLFLRLLLKIDHLLFSEIFCIFTAKTNRSQSIKKSMKRTIFVVLMIAIFIACKKNNIEEFDYPVLSVDITRMNPPSLFDIFRKIEIIPLETTDSSLIGGMAANTVFFNNHYYILDGLSESFYCFDEYGKFVKKIANEGQGPQEYFHAGDFVINESANTAELLSPFGYLYVFELSGKFADKIALPVPKYYHEIAVLNDSLRILLTKSAHHNEDQLYVYSTRSNIIVNSFYREDFASFNFNPRYLYQYNDNVYYYKPLISKVFKIDQHGYEVAYSWDFGALNPENTKLNKSEIDYPSGNNTNERLFKMVMNGQIKGIYNIQYQNDKYYYTLFNRSVNSQILRTNVFYNKRDHKTFVFEKFKDGFVFFPFFWCDDYVLATSASSSSSSKAIDPSILDEENAKKLNELKEEDNPFIIKYYFK